MYCSCQMHGQCLPVAVDKAHWSLNATLMKHSSVFVLRSVLFARDAVMFAHSGLHSWFCGGIYVINVVGWDFPCKLPEKLDSKRETPLFWGTLMVCLRSLASSEGRVTANQYREEQNGHLDPLKKPFYPNGNDLFQDENAIFHWTQGSLNGSLV